MHSDAMDTQAHIENLYPPSSAPPLNTSQSESDVTLSAYSPNKSSDFRFSDPISPPTNTLPQTHQQPPTPSSKPPSDIPVSPPSSDSGSSESEDKELEPEIQVDVPIPGSPADALIPVSPFALIPFQSLHLNMHTNINSFAENANQRASDLISSTTMFSSTVRSE